MPSGAEAQFELAAYFPIFLYLAAVLAFAGVSIVMAHVIGPRTGKKSDVKLMPYESGMDPVGDARQRFDVKFYLVAIMFLVFDVELLFLYPWAVTAYTEGGLPEVMRGPVFWGVLTFLGLLLVAYLYDWRKGVFRWK